MEETVFKEFTFDAAHRLVGHSGACQYLHGHTWTVHVGFRGALTTAGSSRGMVMDFQDINRKILSAKSLLDHRVILEEADPLVKVLSDAGQMVFTLEVRPTVENLARFLMVHLECSEVRIWETPSSFCELRRKQECF